MKVIAIYALLLVLLPAAPSQTVIKGHHMGETVEDFLQIEPDIKSELGSCHAGEPRPMTVEEASKLSNNQVLTMSLRDPSVSSKKKVQQLAKEGKLLTEDQRTPSEKGFCDKLISVLEKGVTLGITRSYMQTYPAWGFSDNKLDFMELEFQSASFPDVVADLTKRVGLAPTESNSPMQNGFGATWVDQRATWLSPELWASLQKSNNPSNSKLILTVMSRSAYDQIAKRTEDRPSPLD